MRFELHCHTKHSTTTAPLDCMEDPVDVIRQAKRAGLSGIAITDHNTISGWKIARKEAKKQGIVFIPGVEISSSEGHILGLGVNQEIKPRQGVDETIDCIHAAGGIAIAAHPYDIRGYGLKEHFIRADVVEVFNALSVDRFSNMLTERKAGHYDMPQSSGSDAHTIGMIGKASIDVKATDMDSVLKEIKKGNAVISKNYVNLNEIKEWSRIRMIEAYIDVLQYIDHKYGRYRAWALKHLMKNFILSRNPVWDIVARISLTGAISYSMIKAAAYY